MKSDVSISLSLRVIAEQANLVSDQDKHLEARHGGDGQQEEADFHQRSSQCRILESPHTALPAALPRLRAELRGPAVEQARGPGSTQWGTLTSHRCHRSGRYLQN